MHEHNHLLSLYKDTLNINYCLPVKWAWKTFNCISIEACNTDKQWAWLSYFVHLVFLFPISFDFPICDFDRTWWRLFQKWVVCTKLDIYVFITIIKPSCIILEQESNGKMSFFSKWTKLRKYIWIKINVEISLKSNR